MGSKKELKKQITGLMIEKLHQIHDELGLPLTKKSSKKNEKLAKKVAKELAVSKKKIDKKALKVETEVQQETQELPLLNSKRHNPNRKNPADKVA